MFRDLPVNPPDPTEMMCSRGISVKHCLCLPVIRLSIEGLMRMGKDWTLMLQPYLILSPNIGQLERLDLKASKSESLLSIVCAALRISNSILKL